MKKVLVTGATGSGGSFLISYILENHPEIEVHGTARSYNNKNIDLIKDKIHLHDCDLTDFSAIFRVLKEVQPDYVAHLGANPNVQSSFDNPLAVTYNNVMSTTNLLEAVRMTGNKAIVQICSTSEVYGSPKETPVTESCPLAPINPYAVSKVHSDLLGLTYYKCYGTKCIVTRMFSYLNPRRYNLAGTAFALQIAQIEAGLKKELVHGNLSSVRNWIDVRDVASSYWTALTECTPGQVYNMGGGHIASIRQLLDHLISLAKCPIPCKTDEKLCRPTDIAVQIPCMDKFVQETGWQPKYKFEESLKYLLDSCRQAVNQSTVLRSPLE